MSVKQIDMKELQNYEGREGFILQGCGGSIKEWIDGINEMLTEQGILLDGTKFTEDDCVSFKNDDSTCILYEFTESTKLDMGKLAMWRLQTHDAFSGKWLTDFVDHQFGGFHSVEQDRVKPDCALIGADGNIFNLMGLASQSLRRNGMADEAIEMTQRIISSANSYDEALNIIGEYVNITSAKDMSEDEYFEEGMDMKYE